MVPNIEDATQENLEAKIRQLARRVFSGERMDDLETWYLAQVVEHCSRTITDIYRTVNLDQILRGIIRRPGTLDQLLAGDSRREGPPIWRVARAPDALRGLGDRCLYDVGMAGVRDYQGVSLETLGVRSYRMAADVLSILANERDLRELFQRNRVRTLPIEEEIVFLRQCATRFSLHAQLLQTLREERIPPGAAAPGMPGRAAEPALEEERSAPDPAPPDSSPLFPPPGIGSGSESRDRLLSRYERILLFADTDLEEVRRRLRREVIDQDEAVDALCDDLLLNATGTQPPGVPPSYFLVGPTGVGKNHLLERLARVLEEIWSVEVPFLIIEGPQYTYPSDVHELRGATRGFIRSDEPGILSEFHTRSSRAPLSILIVDEVEKAHPQLQKFFLPIMDRGMIHDNRGQELHFEGCLIAFTSNLGYSTRESPGEPIGYRGGPAERGRRQRGEADRQLRRSLSPEFLSRLRTLRFSPLTRRSMEAILELELSRVFERFRSLHGLEIKVTDRARARLLDLGFSESRGARHLAATVRRYCNVEVGRRLMRDESSTRGSRGDTVRDLREIRSGSRAFEPAAMERQVRQLARVRVPYRRLVIDERDGEFLYRGQASS